MALKKFWKILALSCPLLSSTALVSTAGAAPVIEQQESPVATTQIVDLLNRLTSTELDWKARFAAEEQLKTLDSSSVLAALVLIAARAMPQGPIWNGAESAEDNRDAPPKWQIFYGVNRVWEHHERKLWNASAPQLSPLSQRLLAELADNPSSSLWVVLRFDIGPPALWTDETEIAFAKLMRDSQNNNYLRSLAIEGLIHKTGAKYYQQAKAIITDFPENSSDETFAKAKSLEGLLWDISRRKNERTGQLESDKELLKTAFELLPKMEQIRVGGGYFLALRLGDYVGQKFVADQKNPKYQKNGNLSEDFFGDTTANALAWWKRTKAQTP